MNAEGESACLAEVGKVANYQEGRASSAKMRIGLTSLRTEGMVAWIVRTEGMVAWITTWGKAQGEWGLCLDGKGTDGGKERNYLLFSDIICQALCDEYGDWMPRSPSTESLWPGHWESWSQAAVRDFLSCTDHLA